jgi:hypothetical protein
MPSYDRVRTALQCGVSKLNQTEVTLRSGILKGVCWLAASLAVARTMTIDPEELVILTNHGSMKLRQQ